VLVLAADEAAHQGEFVGTPGQAGEQFAQLHARHVRRDRPEFAADLRRRIRLQVEEVEMGRAAGQENDNNGLVDGGRDRCGFGP
jgi:hypothetical protein